MEVHHHPHTKGKGFKYYLFEFFMLFLAVFCGFLAENIREHQVEKTSERQYIYSLVQDIKNDSRLLHTIDMTWEKSYNAADSLRKFLAGPEIYTESYHAFNLWNWATGFDDFVPNDGTIQQLLNSGGLRLLRKKSVVDSIMAYQRIIELIMALQKHMSERQIDDKIKYELFDAVGLFNAKQKDNIPLLNKDRNVVNQAFGYINRWVTNFYWLRIYAKNIKERGAGMLVVIKKEYNIQ
ncbi:MAG: hypothetical protein KDC56_05150 [Flavobacteriaceae bacterium]|nr:hypothetical protein [Flavobacteriaceae bacterium]